MADSITAAAMPDRNVKASSPAAGSDLDPASETL
jgi:hypothetical protein